MFTGGTPSGLVGAPAGMAAGDSLWGSGKENARDKKVAEGDDTVGEMGARGLRSSAILRSAVELHPAPQNSNCNEKILKENK
jgi:hypothetical protein